MIEGQVVVQSRLIRPEWNWRDWSFSSQEIHGITRAQLAREGQAARDVAQWVYSYLREAILVSDAPHQDQHWLECLFDAHPEPPPQGWRVMDFDALIGRLEPARQHAAWIELDATPRPHRAGPDAALLASIFWRAQA